MSKLIQAAHEGAELARQMTFDDYIARLRHLNSLPPDKFLQALDEQKCTLPSSSSL